MLLPQVWNDKSRYEETCIDGHTHTLRELMQVVSVFMKKCREGKIFQGSSINVYIGYFYFDFIQQKHVYYNNKNNK